MMLLLLTIKFYVHKHVSIFPTIVFEMLFTISLYTLIIDCLLCITFLIIILLIMITIICNINSRIFCFHSRKGNTHRLYTAINVFIIEHNMYCRELYLINKFWSKIYFMFIITIIPVNLLLLHQFLFECLEYEVKIFFGLLIVLISIGVFGVQYLWSYMSYKIHKSCVVLSQYQWRINGYPFRMRFKLNLMNYFERLSSDRKIGITMGSIYTLTFTIFFQVIFWYCSFKIYKNKYLLFFLFVTDTTQIFTILYISA